MISRFNTIVNHEDYLYNNRKSELSAILEEESERLKKLCLLYREKIENLPKGYISIKKINGHEYAYLAFRDKKRIRSKYIEKNPPLKSTRLKIE